MKIFHFLPNILVFLLYLCFFTSSDAQTIWRLSQSQQKRSHFIQIKIISTNKVVPKMTVRRHVNIGTIGSGQNICPIYNKVGQQFCGFFISQWGLSAPTAKLDLWSSLLTFGRVGVNSTLLSLNRSLPPSVIQWYRLLWSNSRVVFVVFPFQ